MNNALEDSYRRQREHGRDMSLPSCYSAPDTVDNWRHQRMRGLARALLRSFPGARWLTVGDGAYGSDAHYLVSQGASVVASSLVTDTLAVAKAKGYIDEFALVNAEAIAFEDNAFDFVFCKEAYHHFPRPPVALFEMLRVARRAVVLIEPQEQTGVLNGVRTLVKRALRGDTTTEFEPSGNYIYRLNVREIEKLMLAFGLRWVASKPFNDFYWARFAGDSAGRRSRGLAITQAGIGVQNALARLGLMGPGLCCVIVFKAAPEPQLQALLAAEGFQVRCLPENPYARS